MTLLRASRAPAPRTLVDIFEDTVEDYPDDPAVDNGAAVLTYREFHDAAETSPLSSTSSGSDAVTASGSGSRSGTVDLYVAIMGILLSGGCYVPVDADDPDERARTVFAEADVAAVIGRRPGRHHPPRTTGAGRQPDGPEPDDDAWVIFTSGSTGDPQGRRGHPPVRGRVRRRRGAAVPPGRPAGRRRPGDGRAVGRLRRLVRGDVAGLALRRLPGAGTPLAGAQRHGPRALAGGATTSPSSRRSPRCSAVAGRGPGRRPSADLRRRGLPARDRQRGSRPPSARSGTPTARPRPPSSRAAPS